MREQSQHCTVVVIAGVAKKRLRVARFLIDIDARRIRDEMTASPFPPVALVKLGHPPRQQAFLEVFQIGNRAFAIQIYHRPRGATGGGVRADKIGIGIFRLGKNLIRARNRANFYNKYLL